LFIVTHTEREINIINDDLVFQLSYVSTRTILRILQKVKDAPVLLEFS